MALSIEENHRQLIEQKARQAVMQSKSDPTRSTISEPAEFGVISAALAKVQPLKTTAPINTQPPASWLLPSQPAPAQSTAPQPATPPPVSPAPVPPPASTGSSPPMSGPTLVRFFKLGISATILLAGSYFAVKSAYPFLKELSQPGSVKTANPKDAPTSVKILQQTRDVVAKSNANVDHLNAIINNPLGTAITNTPASLPPPPAAPKVKPQVRLERLTGLVLDELHVSGVHGGRNPRIMIDGLLVGIGSVVDAKRRLRFVSLDEARRVIVLSNGVESVEKHY